MIQDILQNLTPKQRRNLLISGAILLAILIGASVWKAVAPKHYKPGDTITRVDKTSGETVRTIVGENETFGDAGGQVLLLGGASLTNLGLTVDQVNAVRTSITQYRTVNSLSFKQASINTKQISFSITDPRTDNEATHLSMPLVLDDKTVLTMKLTYKTMNDLKVDLFDTADKQIYRSGLITL